MNKISVVINTKNSQSSIARTLKSVAWADEIVIMDMDSTDKTVVIAQKYSAKIFTTKDAGFVEAARNQAINKSSYDWILIIDADEEINSDLAKLLRQKTTEGSNIYHLPRKNIIFDKWIKHTGWWPDYQLRFFKKDSVDWPKKIHADPIEKSPSQKLPAIEANAIIHHNYQTLDQFVSRLNQYTTIQAQFLAEQGKNASIKLLVKEPIDEFLRRYFLFQGFKDGTHGLVLSLLQSFSQLLTILKLWQIQKFKDLEIESAPNQIKQSIKDIKYWLATKQVDQSPPTVKRFYWRLRRKLRL